MMDQPPATEIETPPDVKVEGNSALQDFLKKFAQIENNEEKLREALGFMRTSLGLSGAPNFKGFWEIRKLSLPLFKEGLSTPLRAKLWEEYVELTKEGRRLKELSDQESAFAVEQIEMAVKSLELDVERFQHWESDLLAKSSELDLPHSTVLKEKKETYLALQRRLNLLGAFASHIHALRKELIKTEMRIRVKNNFFDRLSQLGDKIFPVRKELIKEISTLFTADVDRFVEENFSPSKFCQEKARHQVFFFRDEIKALQASAKIFTLNVAAFSATREQLSQCWDKLKGMEKELKKEYTQQKQKSGENFAMAEEKIRTAQEAFAAGSLSADEMLNQLAEIARWMRGVELVHHDVKALKEALAAARALPESKKEEEEAHKKQRAGELEEKKRALLETFKGKIDHLKQRMNEACLESLSEEICSLRTQLNETSLPKREKMLFEKSLKEMRETVEEKKEEKMLLLPPESQAALEDLKGILASRKERRCEIKEQIEELRKVMGGSSLDFEKAIEYRDQMAKEKERLEKIDESIAEIEEKMNALKKR